MLDEVDRGERTLANNVKNTPILNIKILVIDFLFYEIFGSSGCQFGQEFHEALHFNFFLLFSWITPFTNTKTLRPCIFRIWVNRLGPASLLLPIIAHLIFFLVIFIITIRIRLQDWFVSVQIWELAPQLPLLKISQILIHLIIWPIAAIWIAHFIWF